MKAASKKTPSCVFLSTILLRPRHMAGEVLSLIFCMLEHRLKSWNATVGRDSSPCHTPKIEGEHNTTTEEHRHPLPYDTRKMWIWSQHGSMAFISSWLWLPLIQSIYLNGGYGYAESQRMPPVDAVVCSTKEQCLAQFSSMNTGGNFVAGSFETKGCFSINRDVYFGTGGAVNEFDLAETDLPGVLQRIWCDKDDNTPTMNPSDQLTVISATISASDPTPSVQTSLLPTVEQSLSSAEQPLTRPFPVNPTSKPSHMQVTRQPTTHPMSNKPISSIQTIAPTPTMPLVQDSQMMSTKNNATLFPSTANRTIETVRPFLMPASKQPTTNPSSSPSSTRTKQPSSAPTTVSPNKQLLTANPTPMSTVASPTVHPTLMPVIFNNATILDRDIPPEEQEPAPLPSGPSLAHTKQPSSAPTTVSPSKQLLTSNPTPMPTVASPTVHPTLMPALIKNLTVVDRDIPPEEQESASLPLYPVGVSPLEISLSMDPQTESVDLNELTLFILNHLLIEMENKFLPIEGSSSYILVSPVPEKIMHPQASPLDTITFIKCDFIFIGLFYFSGGSVPTVEVLDKVTRESFAGESGKKFVSSLRNAEDVGLRSIMSVSAVASSENTEVIETTLESAKVSPTAFNFLYILAMVFSFGLLVIAMKVLKTFFRRGEIPNNDSESSVSHQLARQSKSSKLSSELSGFNEIGQARDNSEDKYSVHSVYSSIRDAMSVFSIENIREATSDLMSLLTQDDEVNGSVQDMSEASTPRCDKPKPKREVQSMAVHLPSYWRRNDDASSHSSHLDECNFCGVVGDQSVPRESGTKTLFVNDDENVRDIDNSASQKS